MTGIERTLQLRNFLVYNFVFWVALCLLDVIQTLSFSIGFDSPFDISNIIRWPTSVYLAYWILSYAIFDLYQQARNLRKQYFFMYLLAGGIIFGIAHKILSSILGLLLERLFLKTETKTWMELLDLWGKTQFDMLGSIVIYCLVLIILIGLDYYRKFNDQHMRRLELEGELGKAQLKTMKMQLNPHFLFNAFNTISMMVRQMKNDEAVNMINGLSVMMRISLNKELTQFVQLGEEIDLLKTYLNIESQRYQDRLTVHWDIEDEVLKYEVPNFVLQPIVENAFKHGISKTLGQARLKISVKLQKGRIILSVFNTGSGLPSNWELQRDKGVGLANTIDRLLRLYKEEFKFVINEHEDGVSVTLTLPQKIR